MIKYSATFLQKAKKRFNYKNTLISSLLFIIVILVVWMSLLQLRSPDVVPRTAASNQFSAERSLEYLKNIAVKPRPPGSDEHSRIRDYIFETLSSMGLSPEIQTIDIPPIELSNIKINKIENIVAKIPGVDSSKAVMLAAHYDSVEDSPGAADDGAGVAAILETVSILKNSAPLKNDIIILISDGEEFGLLGSQAFVREHPWAQEVGIVLNFEARGNTGPSVLFESSEGNDRLIAEFIKTTPNPIAYSVLNDLYELMPNITDMDVFKEVGMYGLNFAFFEGEEMYHSPNDTIDNLSLNSLQHHGDYMVNLIKHYGDMQLVSKEEGNRLYFNFIGNKVVTYLEAFVLPLMIVSTICFIFTLIHGYFIKKLTVSGLIIGLILFLLTVGLVFIITQSLQNQLINIDFDEKINDNIFIGMILLVALIFSLIYRVASKKVRVTNLIMGASIVWLILIIITSINYKDSSYIFVWPFLIGLVCINVFFRMKNENSIKGRILSTVCMIPILLLTSPPIYLVYVLFGLEEIAVLMSLITLLGIFFIPMFSTLKVHDTMLIKKKEPKDIFTKMD